jgi:Calx-beta domain
MPRDLVTAPAYIRFDFGSPSEILITPADQMDALTLTFTELFSDQMTQASQSRADATVAGLNVEATISIANIGNMALFNQLFQGSDDLSTGTAPSRKILTGVASRPGCPVIKKPTMIKLASCDGESTDVEDWFFLPSAALFTNNTSFTFGNSDQSSYTVTLSAFDPKPSSEYYPYKVLRGDITAIAPLVRTVNLSPTTPLSIAESGGTRTFTVTLSQAHTLPVTVPYTTSGTATAGTDYTIAPATPLTIAAGQTTGTITITSLADGTSDAGETIILTLGTPTNATLGTNTTATTTIT